MKFLSKIVILSSIIFSIFILSKKTDEQINYFTTKEEYYLAYDNQQLDIPLFISSNEFIFRSSLVSYYLNIADLTYKINKENVTFFHKSSFLKEDIYCYIISFKINLDINKRYEDAVLCVEYDSKSILFDIGNINILGQDIKVDDLSLFKTGLNVYRYNGILEFNNISNLDKYYYDLEYNYTYIVFETDTIYHFIYCINNEEEIYIKYINYDYDILKLKLQEVTYA